MCWYVIKYLGAWMGISVSMWRGREVNLETMSWVKAKSNVGKAPSELVELLVFVVLLSGDGLVV
jgi:hypothetical protein